MKLLVLLAADYASLEANGKLNVMGIFRHIYARAFPARHATMYLVAKLGADLGETSEERQLVIKLLDNDGSEVVQFEQPFSFPKPAGGQRPEANFIVRINDLVFEKPGVYEFVLLVDGHHQGDLAIDLVQLETPSE